VIYVNGAEHEDAASVAELLARLGLGEEPRGSTSPSSASWSSQRLDDGARVEVVGAIQGG
jgi:sulfur carrier protein ThiS